MSQRWPVAKVFAELENVAQSVRVFEFMNVAFVESDLDKNVILRTTGRGKGKQAVIPTLCRVVTFTEAPFSFQMGTRTLISVTSRGGFPSPHRPLMSGVRGGEDAPETRSGERTWVCLHNETFD